MSESWTPPQLPGFGPWKDTQPASELPVQKHRWECDSIDKTLGGISAFHAMLDYYGPGALREYAAAIGGNNLWAGYPNPEAALTAAMAGFTRRVRGPTLQETRRLRKEWRDLLEKLSARKTEQAAAGGEA